MSARKSEIPTDKPAKPQYTAAFRGRIVRGLEVSLPPGYGGVVLRSDRSNLEKDASFSQASTTRKKRGLGKAMETKKGRFTRRSSKMMDVDEAEDDDQRKDLVPDDEDYSNLLASSHVDATNVKTLKPSATFSSFVVWNPDIPVDEGSDEYILSLTEWMSVSAEVRQKYRFHFIHAPLIDET